jgi:hypothetical protein
VKRSSRVGAATIEMTLVGIPMLFILISIFEISRGMWISHTTAYAVKEGVRFASVHGQNCVYNPPSVINSCTTTEAGIAALIQNAGIGLDPATTQLTFCTGFCGSGSTPTCALNACASTTWPPSGGNQLGQTIEIDITTPFYSALAMLWPGAGKTSFGVFNFGSTASDTVKF